MNYNRNSRESANHTTTAWNNQDDFQYGDGDARTTTQSSNCCNSGCCRHYCHFSFNAELLHQGLQSIGDTSHAIFATHCGRVFYQKNSNTSTYPVYSIGKTIVTTWVGIHVQNLLRDFRQQQQQQQLQQQRTAQENQPQRTNPTRPQQHSQNEEQKQKRPNLRKKQTDDRNGVPVVGNQDNLDEQCKCLLNVVPPQQQQQLYSEKITPLLHQERGNESTTASRWWTPTTTTTAIILDHLRVPFSNNPPQAAYYFHLPFDWAFSQGHVVKHHQPEQSIRHFLTMTSGFGLRTTAGGADGGLSGQEQQQQQQPRNITTTTTHGIPGTGGTTTVSNQHNGDHHHAAVVAAYSNNAIDFLSCHLQQCYSSLVVSSSFGVSSNNSTFVASSSPARHPRPNDDTAGCSCQAPLSLVHQLFSDYLGGYAPQDPISLESSSSSKNKNESLFASSSSSYRLSGFGGGLHISARDLTRIGLLYLANGQWPWNNTTMKTIVPRDFVTQSFRVQVPANTFPITHQFAHDPRWNIPELSVALPYNESRQQETTTTSSSSFFRKSRMAGMLGYGYGVWVLEENRTIAFSGKKGNYVLIDRCTGLVVTILNHQEDDHPSAKEYLAVFRNALRTTTRRTSTTF